ncbi:antitoxin [Yinghuangia seranimata]|uniref:antitoxin n=1 Tax=Yinghuangia seranimata TaxID=408067 RepID=UPI0031BB1A80
MGVFDWFRRGSSPAAAQDTVSAEPEQPGSVGTLVEERPATGCCLPAQKSDGCEDAPETAPEAEAAPEAADGAPEATLVPVPRPASPAGEAEGEQDMGLLDTIKEKLAPHGDKASQAVDKAADVVDEKTGGKYGDQIDAGAEKAKDVLGIDDTPDDAPQAAEPAPEAAPSDGENPPA